jgi:cytoskeletal protein CcmA (bactofilin family)
MLNDDTNSYDPPTYQPHTLPSDADYASQPSAIIGSKIRFKGELVGEEDLLIQGTVDGTIDLKGNSLTVGKDGTVRANVMAKTITVEGRVEGDIFGEEKITIKKSSLVKGNIVAARVSLEDGAKFKGSIDMDVDEANFKQPNSVSPKTDLAVKLDTSDKKSSNNVDKHKPKLN